MGSRERTSPESSAGRSEMKSMALGSGAEIFEDGGLLVGVCIASDIIVVQFRLKRKLSGFPK